MPTIELISVNATQAPVIPELQEFCVRSSTDLISDRGLFQRDLSLVSGVILHLGQDDDITGEHWFCGPLLEWNNSDSNLFGFESVATSDLLLLLALMRDASPEKRVLFLTDLQAGPKKGGGKQMRSLSEFVDLSDACELRFNTLYDLRLNNALDQQKSGAGNGN